MKLAVKKKGPLSLPSELLQLVSYGNSYKKNACGIKKPYELFIYVGKQYAENNTRECCQMYRRAKFRQKIWSKSHGVSLPWDSLLRFIINP
jgi:hypothetical protein